MNPQSYGEGRRQFLRLGAAGAIGLLAAAIDRPLQPATAAAAELPAPLTPDAALQALMAGNQRFVQQIPTYPHQTQVRLREVAEAQHPFATVLSCADSRVPAELIFDQGIGDIFDIRIAGNIATPEAIGSIEYAVALLETPLLMVLGHERCGAVTATVQSKPLPGMIGSFVQAIQPALAQVEGMEGDAIENLVVANVRYQVAQVARSALLQERLQSGKLKIVGGRYDLDTGSVSLIA